MKISKVWITIFKNNNKVLKLNLENRITNNINQDLILDYKILTSFKFSKIFSLL